MEFRKRAALLFFLAAIAFYFYGLGHLPFLGPDEPRYAEVAREMYERADLVTPTLGGHTWFEKPALLYWMMIGSYRLFGVSEWAARFGPALSGLLTIFLIFWLGRRIERAGRDEMKASAGLGLWSSVALGSSAGLIVFSHAASFDIVVTMTLTTALACFFSAEIETDGKKRRWLLAGFYASVGASLLAKGLVGIVLPFGVIGTYYLMRWSWPRRTAWLSALWGVPLAFAIALVWYAPVIARHGWPFVDQFFIQHHFARFVSNKFHHPQAFYFYLPIIAMIALPWSAFLVSALNSARKWRWREETIESKSRVFALAWLVFPTFFFSISISKLPGYILPALPGAALLAGAQLRRFVRGEGGFFALRFTSLLLFALATGVIIYSARTGDLSLACAFVIAAPLIIIGAFSLLFPRHRVLVLELICSAMFIAVALVFSCGVDRIAGRESVRDLMQLATARGYASTPVFYMLTDDRTGEFYAGGRLGYRPDGEPYRFDGADEVAEAARQRGGTALVFVPTKWANQLTDYSAIETEIIGNNGSLTLALIRVR